MGKPHAHHVSRPHRTRQPVRQLPEQPAKYTRKPKHTEAGTPIFEGRLEHFEPAAVEDRVSKFIMSRMLKVQ